MLAQGAGEPAPPRRGLRLRAEDAEDLAVVSACLQDALVTVRDLVYDREAARFVLAANRFCWEGGGHGGAPFERSLCLIAFDAVSGVVYRGFQRREEQRILSLLAIRSTCGRASGCARGEVSKGREAGVTIDLEFADGATLRLCAAAIRCRARDFGDPWPTRRQPGHSLDGTP
ncbi:MAG TPA: DUF2948 family protein [Stellaceae bacterium]|nr:DUF2948 family protein [Stellaceae bacterium]